MGRTDSLLTLLALSPSLWGKKKGAKKPDGDGKTTPVAMEVHIGSADSSISTVDGGGSGSWFGKLVDAVLDAIGRKRAQDHRHDDENRIPPPA